ANDNLEISGIVSANGGAGQSATNYSGAGSGSGGGIHLRGTHITITGTVRARGGSGGSGPGSGGGGGSGGGILIEGSLVLGSGTVDGSGGAGGSGGCCSGGAGGGGRIRVFARNSPSLQLSGFPSGAYEFYRLPPTAPNLVFPINGATLTDTPNVVFSWTESEGADNYRFLVDDDPSLESPEENLLLGRVTQHATSLKGEKMFYWKVVAINPSGENESETRSFTQHFSPEILAISCDNILVDRRRDFAGSGASEATVIEAEIRDNGGAQTVSAENVRFWVRAADGTVVVENQPATTYYTVDENRRKFFFAFNPPDDLPDSALGPFDVKVQAFDNLGLEQVQDFDGLGSDCFVVDDLQVEIFITDNTPVHQVSVSGNIFRGYNSSGTSADDVVVEDNNEGGITADFTDNFYSKTYGLTSPLRLHRGDLGYLYVWARDDTLDGASQILTYEVEGDNLQLLNFITIRHPDRTEVLFDARWASDGSDLVTATVYLPENSAIMGQVSGRSGSVIIPHSLRLASGSKTLSAFDNANRPIWNVQSQSFWFNILPVAADLKGDNSPLPARTTPTPLFSWSFQDNNPNDTQLGARIQVGPTLDSNDLWDWTDAGYISTSKLYEGNPLQRGCTYYLRMVVRDSQLEWQNQDNSDLWTRATFRVNNLPQVSVLLIEGEVNPVSIGTKTPKFEWTYQDEDGEPQVKYQIQVGTTENGNDMWDYTATSDENSAVYSGPPLQDGAEYFVRIRVFDGLEWSDWKSGFFLAPYAPPTPPPGPPSPPEENQPQENLPRDNLPPEIRILQFTERILENEAFLLRAKITDNSPPVSAEVLLDNRPVPFSFSDNLLQVRLENLPAGTHALILRARDNLGNTSEKRLGFEVLRVEAGLPYTVEFLGASLENGVAKLRHSVRNESGGPVEVVLAVEFAGRKRYVPVTLLPGESEVVEVRFEDIPPGEYLLVVEDNRTGRVVYSGSLTLAERREEGEMPLP
ncbi:MAG: hypothetical protein QW356_09005, partial [Candidatus Hadarchaeales archaeon]